MYALSLWPFTLIHSLLFVAGVCAWAVWASRLRDSQSELVERLTGQAKRESASLTSPPAAMAIPGPSARAGQLPTAALPSSVRPD